jgi:NAD(P)-dependent dehydrogenase (short-subunit alcohol dehydrogenase family)
MTSPVNLQGAVVAITGGARGIGLAIAEALSAAGARVSLGDVDVALAKKEAKRLGAFAHVLDVRKRDSFAEFLRATTAALGPVTVLVNNAGIMPMGSFLDEDPALSDAQIDINFRGVLIGMQSALPAMIASGHGHIVNVASLCGRFALPGAAVYCGTKFAVVGMTETVAAEYRDSGVNFTVIMPSAVRTELISGSDTASRGLPVVSPEEVAAAVVHSIQAPRLFVAVPGYMETARTVYDMLPERVRDMGRRLIDDHRLLKKLDRKAHASYDQRIAELAEAKKS